MDSSLGRLTARLADPGDNGGAPNLIDQINRNINPPTPVTAGSVHIRAMYIVSDEVNSFGGRFPADEHAGLCRLLVDSPVMIGHRKDRLPIARVFHASVVERDGRRWVKGWFYWLRAADGAETLRENIDGGIYRECSISFTFLLPECSVCGKDIRTCAHQPFERYTVDNAEHVCHYRYRRVERVLETSLVYRGAVADTRLTNELTADCRPAQAPEVPLHSLTELPAAERYLVVPCYHGIPVTASVDEGTLRLKRLDGRDLPPLQAERHGMHELPDFEAIPGYLLGMRGKERCAEDQVERYLLGEASPVTRLQLRLFPSEDLGRFRVTTSDGAFSVCVIRHRYCPLPELAAAAAEVATRDGVRIWPEHISPGDHCGYRYRPDPIPRAGAASYTLTQVGETGAALFSFVHESYVHRFLVHQFNLHRLLRCGKFLADRYEAGEGERLSNCFAAEAKHLSGQIFRATTEDLGFSLHLSGKLAGNLVVRPIKIEGERRYLLYRAG